MNTKLIIKRKINAPCKKVFEAWSKPEIMEKWFFPPQMNWKATATNEFKVGGHYKLVMMDKDGTTHTHTGEYKEIIPNKKIVFTWSSHIVKDTLVTVELHEIKDQTEITLTHDLFPSEEVCLRHQWGWDGCLENMNHHFLGKSPSCYSFRCDVHFDAPIEKVYEAITSEKGLKNWWTTDCTVPLMALKSKSIFRFGKTYNVMKTIELVPNQTVVWECLEQHMAEPGLPESDKGEWVGTKLVFHLVENGKGGTELYFAHEGLTAELSCFNHCNNCWNHFLKKSLKGYVGSGIGEPHREKA